MPEALVDIGPEHRPLAIRINGMRPTFRLGSEKIAAKLLKSLDPLEEDLLEIAATIFAADSSVPRGGPTRPDMGMAWRRSFGFRIPVRVPAFWRRHDVLEVLTEAVSFLTDDRMSFEFVGNDPEGVSRQGWLDFDPSADPFAAEEVILFSGGLDSFAGALDALHNRQGKVVLVSHRSAQKVIPRQVRLAAYLADRFPGRVLHIAVNATRVGTVGVETTQRSRSLLFASLGQVVARKLGAKHVSFYENGIVSHNLPISPQVIGTMATRTTHPKALLLLDALMQKIGDGTVPTRNPYAWMTKKEVIERIVQCGGSSMISAAVSCTSVRDQDTMHTHCGACSQCLDRRFAILAAGQADHDPPESYGTDVLLGERTSDRSITMAVDWSRHAIRLASMEKRSFQDTFGLEMMRIVRGHPDLPQNEVLDRSFQMQQRHGRAVAEVLEHAIADNASALVGQKLPATSLLRLQVGTAPLASLPSDPRLRFNPTPSRPLMADEIVDLVLNEDDPLILLFNEGDRKRSVTVVGLCDLTGRSADVLFVLKPQFDDDKADGRRRAEYRYLTSGEVAREFGVSKSAVQQLVLRCRKSVDEAYALVFDHSPTKDLVVETLRPQGYRLVPELRIASYSR